MVTIKKFTFNAFQENTYVLSDPATKECFIIDPGCSNTQEDVVLLNYIDEHKLKPIKLINTHCHIDHVLGNQLIASKYNLSLEAHQLEVPVLQSCNQVSKFYGIPFRGSPEITRLLKEGDDLHLGTNVIQLLLTPGHSPGSLCLHLPDQHEVIGGDVLFQGSIGRTDLPGGDYDTLIRSIKTKLLPLPDNTIVHPGHGPSTTIGDERRMNPFLQ